MANPDPSAAGAPAERTLGDLVFVGVNSRVAALDRYTGELVWSWKAPSGRGFVSLLLDGDRLIASIQGYTYCLEPITGRQVWMNALRGFGLGVACVASLNGTSSSPALLAQAQDQQTRQSAASASGA